VAGLSTMRSVKYPSDHHNQQLLLFELETVPFNRY